LLNNSQGKTSVVVSFGTGAGIIGLTDTIKHDSISAIKQLQALNIELIMLTGIVKSSSLCRRCRRYQKVFSKI
jgi:Cd2+/Zn2+-exporting ATPase